MTTVTLVYPPTYSNLGERLRADMTAAGITVVEDIQPGREALLVLVLAEDAHIAQDAYIIGAADNNQHIIPVVAERVPLPAMIDNLAPLDFSQGYDKDALLGQIERLSAPNAPPPLMVLTPSRRAANRRTALWFIPLIAVLFVAAVIGIVLGITVPPEDEFAGVETQIYLTQRYFIDQVLPQGTEQAANFEAALEDIPTRALQEAIMTATAIAGGVEGTFIPQSTADATAFEATLEHVSTLVQDRLAATVTAVAATAAAGE